MAQQPLDYQTQAASAPREAELRTPRRIRRLMGFLALAAFIFSCFNSSDRNSLQWPSTFIFMGFLALYLLTVLVVWNIQLTHKLKLYRQRRKNG